MAPAPAWQSHSSIESALASNLTPISQESSAFLLQGKCFVAAAALPMGSGTSVQLCSKDEVQMAAFLFFLCLHPLPNPCVFLSNTPMLCESRLFLPPPSIETHRGHASVWLLFPTTPSKLRATPEPRELIFHLRS